VISIIVPVYNRLEEILRCLASIQAQSYYNYEIILLDDNSSEAIDSLKDKVTLYKRNERNYGPAYSRNLGVLYSKGDVLLFLDSDSELMPHALESIEKLLKSNPSIGCVGGCGPLAFEGDDTAYIKGKYYNRLGKNQSVQYGAKDFETQEYIECDHFESACLAVRKDVFMEVGGFDPYWFYMGEDREFCLKVRQLGYCNVISWKTRAIHHEKDLGTKQTEASKTFFLRRFFEVSLKLHGVFGGLLWLWGNRKSLDKTFFQNLLANTASLRHVLSRRQKSFINETTLQEYRRSKDENRKF